VMWGTTYLLRSPRALVPTIRAVQTAAEQRVTGARGLEQLEASPDTAGVKHRPVRCRTAKNWGQNSADRMRTGLKRAQFVTGQKRGERGSGSVTHHHMPTGHRAAASGLQSTGVRDRTPQVVVVGVSAVTAYTAPHRSESERGDFSHVNFKFHTRTEGGMDLKEHVNLES
jgi:hypothetical protein